MCFGTAIASWPDNWKIEIKKNGRGGLSPVQKETIIGLVTKEAPKFQAEAVVGSEFKEPSLDDYKGKWMVLFFYPLDFTFVCPTAITAFSDNYEKFAEAGAEILGCSVDSKFSHRAWINSPRNEGGLGRIKYPLLADIDPEGKVAFEVAIDCYSCHLCWTYYCNELHSRSYVFSYAPTTLMLERFGHPRC